MAGVLYRLVLVCEHPIFAEGLRALFDETDDLVVSGEASAAAEAFKLVSDLAPDVVVVDVRMHYADGPSLFAKLAREVANTKIVVLSDLDDGCFIRRTIDAGAKGFVLKCSPRDAIVHAVRAAAAGGMYIDPVAAARVFPGQAHPVRQNDVWPSSDLLPLTFREQDVVRLIALGYTTKEIAADLSITMKTVDTYKARACEKLGMRTRVQIVRLAVARGWLSDIGPPGPASSPSRRPASRFRRSP